jgi:hypothetical protein
MGLPPFHVEKDFWGYWLLAVFFNDAGVGPNLTFRGVTSLSKAWGIIEGLVAVHRPEPARTGRRFRVRPS